MTYVIQVQGQMKYITRWLVEFIPRQDRVFIAFFVCLKEYKQYVEKIGYKLHMFMQQKQKQDDQ